MRFRIDCPRLGRASYTLHVRDTMIAVPVQSASSNLSWTWWDGTNHALIAPAYRPGQPCSWYIVSNTRIACSRHVLYPTWQEAFLRLLQAAAPRVEWRFDDRVVLAKEGAWFCWMCPRTWTLRQRDGRRLAFWRGRMGGFEGVWRGSLDEELVPIVFGMILAEIHDLVSHSSEGSGD